MFSYTITIYEKSGSTVIETNNLATTYKLDESLDSALIEIPLSTRNTPFDRGARLHIEISDGSNTKTDDWLVYSRELEIESKGTYKSYSHTLGLIEPTFWMNLILTGTLCHTQPIDGTQKTMADVVNRIIELSPFTRYDKESTTRLVTLDSDLETTLSGIPAPQLYVDKKNMREHFINAFKVVNAVPRLIYDSGWILTADFLNINNLNFTIEDNAIDYKRTGDLENFGFSMQMFNENTIPNETEDNANVIIKDLLYINSDDLIIGDSNFKIFTSYPIEFLKKITVITAFGSNLYQETEYDATDYILEKKIYDTKDYDNSNSYNKGSRACLGYWTYRTNEIDGLNNTYNIYGTGLALENILKSIANDNGTTLNASWNSNSSFRVAFRVEYIPYIKQMRSEQYREDVNPYDLTSDLLDKYISVQVNPSERANNLFDLSSNLYGQAQRLSLDTISFSVLHTQVGTYDPDTNTGGIYSFGDYTDDGYYITKVELIWYNDFVIGRYEATKNWNRISQFVQVDKQFRPYEIALTSSDFALKRDVSMPFIFIEVSSDIDSNHGADLNSGYTNLVSSFMNTFKNSTDELLVTNSVIQVGGISGSNVWTYVNGVLKPLQLVPEKNTIKFRAEFDDTKIAGYQIEQDVVLGVTTKNKTIVAYTESDGTAELYKISLYKNYWELQDWVVTVSNLERIDNIRKLIQELPSVNTSYNVAAKSNVNTAIKVYANIYTNESEFLESDPQIGVLNEYYVGLDTLTLYQYDGVGTPYGYSEISEHVFAIKNDAKFTLPFYRVQKDRSEILGFEMSMPIIPNKEYFNNFVIGDYLVKDNNLLIERETARALYFATSTTRYSKSNTNNVGTSGITATTIDSYIIDNKIGVPTSVRDADYYSIIDSSGNLYLAVNQRNLDGSKTTIGTINFNFLAERN